MGFSIFLPFVLATQVRLFRDFGHDVGGPSAEVTRSPQPLLPFFFSPDIENIFLARLFPFPFPLGTWGAEELFSNAEKWFSVRGLTFSLFSRPEMIGVLSPFFSRRTGPIFAVASPSFSDAKVLPIPTIPREKANR